MNQYMLIFKGGDPDWMEQTTPEEMKAAMDKWGTWMEGLAEQGLMENGGSPLDYGGKRLSKEKIVTDIAAAEFKELVTGYSIIKAENYQHASELAQDCPIFDYPITEVEIRQIACIESN